MRYRYNICTGVKKIKTKTNLAISGAILGVTGLLAALVMPLAVNAATTSVYNAIPSTLPPNMASLGFQATQTSEFGDYVHLEGTNRNLKTVTVTMSNWALAATPANVAFCAAQPTKCPSGGFVHPITLNVYNAVSGSPLNTKGSLLGTVTQDVTVPWRPVADSTCSTPTTWRAGNGQCYNGIAFNATFDLSSLNVVLPNDVIVGIAYNTQSYGPSPLGVSGPYNSLNVGVEGSATVGTDDNTDRVFWNTSTAGWYTDGGAGGVGIFREDTAWTPYGTVAIQITAGGLMPTNKDQCKKDSWKTFSNPTFKNQGDCVSHVASNGKSDR